MVDLLAVGHDPVTHRSTDRQHQDGYGGEPAEGHERDRHEPELVHPLLGAWRGDVAR